MHIDVAAFLESLKIMGIGMLGIFIVTMVLIGVMVLLTKAFPEKKEDKQYEKTRLPLQEAGFLIAEIILVICITRLWVWDHLAKVFHFYLD